MIESKKLPLIFDYLDFRAYLKDMLEHIRISRPAFSFKHLITDFGFKSRSHLIDVIKGRPLTPRYVPAYLKFCGLEGKAADYFSAVVTYNQAKTDLARELAWETILALSPNLSSIQLENEAYEYFSRWYYPVMIAVLDINRSERDHRVLAKMLKPEISAVQARHAIKALTRLGFIEWDRERGEWKLLNKFFQCTDHGQALALKRFHVLMQQQGMDAYKNDFGRQIFSTLTLSMSLKTRSEVASMISDLRKSILQKVRQDTHPEVAVQINFQMFDSSKRKTPDENALKKRGRP